MTTLRELVGELRLDFNRTGFDRFEQALATAKGGLIGLGTILTGVTAGITAATVAIAKQANALNDSAVSIGINVEELQRIGYAAQQSGADVDTMRQGLTFLSRQAFDAANGSKEAAANFARAGVRVRDAAGNVRSAGDIFRDFSDRIKATENPTVRTALAADLLGRNAGPRLVQLLQDGSAGIDKLGAELEQLGGLMSAEFVQQSKEFDDSMDRVRAVITGVQVAIGRAFLPTLRQVIDRFVEWWKVNGELVRSGITAFVERFASALSGVGVVISAVTRGWTLLFDLFGRFRGVAVGVAAALGLIALTIALPFGPLLLLAALFGLALEELDKFSKGHQSLLGDIVKEWDNFIAALKEAHPWLSKFFSFLGDRGPQGEFSKDGTLLRNPLADAFGDNPAADVLPTYGPTVQQLPAGFNMVNHFTNHVTAGPGMDAGDVARQVAGRTADALDTQLRAAHARAKPKAGSSGGF